MNKDRQIILNNKTYSNRPAEKYGVVNVSIYNRHSTIYNWPTVLVLNMT